MWLKKTIAVLLAGGMLFCLFILAGKSFLGDLFVLKWIKTADYTKTCLYLFSLFIFFMLFLRKEIQKINVHVVVLISFIFIFFSVFQYDYYPLAIEADGVGYFAYLHSMYFDHDLRFKNEYRELHAARYGVYGWISEKGKELYPMLHRTKRQPNAFSIGPSLLWYPFYTLADLINQNDPRGERGYGPIYLNIVRFSHIVYGLLAAILLYFTLIAFFRPGTSFLTVLFVLFLSPTYYYIKSQTFYSHIPSFFAISLFLFIFSRVRNNSSYLYWAAMGSSIGFAALMRWQNAVLLLLPIFYFCFYWFKNKINVIKMFRQEISKIMIFLVSFFVFCLPQLIAFKIIYDSYFLIPQGDSFLSAFPFWIVQTLFSSFHGLFYWHPVLILGVIGFFIKYRGLDRNSSVRNFFYTNALGFSFQTYINSSMWQYWAGSSFGARRFIDALGFLALGIANFLEMIWQNRALRMLFIPLFYLLFFFNVFLEKAYTWSMILHNSPVSWWQMFSACSKAFPFLYDTYPRMIYFLFLFVIAMTLVAMHLFRSPVHEFGEGSRL